MVAVSSTKELPYEEVILSDNRLEGEKIETLIQNISLNAKKIDLSNNKLGKLAQNLFSHISLKKS